MCCGFPHNNWTFNDFPRSHILQDSSEIIKLNKDLLFHLSPSIDNKECPYKKILWDHLGKTEKIDLRSTKNIFSKMQIFYRIDPKIGYC